MAKILVVEDDQSVSRLITATLSVAGYETTPCYNGEDAVDMIMEKEWDLVLLDIMLPGINGFEVIQRTEARNFPTIFLTAKEGVEDRVYGLRLGAEDYIVKPFEPVELLARIEVVMRRYHRTQNVLEFRDVFVDVDQRTVTKGGVPVELKPKEFNLLVLFMRNPGIALTREKILSAVWGFSFEGETRTVDIHVQRLRKKLDWDDCITTVFRFGYRLENPQN